eukprot:5236440-Amphidinium_carterae.1
MAMQLAISDCNPATTYCWGTSVIDCQALPELVSREFGFAFTARIHVCSCSYGGRTSARID